MTLTELNHIKETLLTARRIEAYNDPPNYSDIDFSFTIIQKEINLKMYEKDFKKAVQNDRIK